VKQILTTLSILAAFFILFFVYTKIAGPIPFSVNSVTTNKSDTFSVNGIGKTVVKPDMAVVSVGIQANGSTVKQAQDQINSTINKVSINVKNLGIETQDIQTVNYNINPSIDYNNGSQRITGFQANTNLSIKVRDIDKVNSVIDAATLNGANQVGNITFGLSDRTKAEDEARQKAVAEAKKKAEDAARIAGFNLGRIINYSENFGGSPQPIMMDSKAIGGLGAGTPTNVESGSAEIQVGVTLSYEIR
jgi:uncharacterized protein YggE